MFFHCIKSSANISNLTRTYQTKQASLNPLEDVFKQVQIIGYPKGGMGVPPTPNKFLQLQRGQYVLGN